GHPHGEGGDFAEVHMRGVAEAALAGAAGQRVLHAVADEGVQIAVVHADRDADDERPLGNGEAFEDAGIEVDGPGYRLQLLRGHSERGRFGKERDGGMFGRRGNDGRRHGERPRYEERKRQRYLIIPRQGKGELLMFSRDAESAERSVPLRKSAVKEEVEEQAATTVAWSARSSRVTVQLPLPMNVS